MLFSKEKEKERERERELVAESRRSLFSCVESHDMKS
jgi:hypothetical protein